MMLLRIWLVSFAVVISACQSALKDVPPPKGNFCSFSKRSLASMCVDIQSIQRTGSVSVENMDKWITMPPSTWESIQNRLDLLENRLQNNYELMSDDMRFFSSGLKSDLRRFKNHLRKLRASSLNRR